MKERRELLFYFSSLLFAIWGIGNIFYFEIYLNYPACFICKCHRALYFSLFFLTIFGFFTKSRFFIIGIFLVVFTEILVSFILIFNLICFDGLCRFASLVDKLNIGFALIVFLVLIISLTRKMGIKK